MPSRDEITFRVYDKRMGLLGVIGNPVSADATLQLHGPGTMTMQLRATDPMLEDILAKGSRVGLAFRGVHWSGMRRALSGKILTNGNVQFTVQGDRRILANTLAYIAPANPVSPTSLDPSTPEGLAQAWALAAGAAGTVENQSGYMVWPTGVTAEAAIKWLITSNVQDRLGRPVVVAPNQDRGGIVPLPSVRVPSVAEAIQPILDVSGLRVTMAQEPGSDSILIDVAEPATWRPLLTAESGVIADGDWSLAPPNATRILIGGPGEEAARAFFEQRDTTGLEDDYGDVIEVFRDATGANLTWPSTLTDPYKIAKYFLLRPEVPEADKAKFRAYITEAADKGLAEGLPTTSVDARLSETKQFRFGADDDGVQLGDLVTVRAANGVEFQDRVTQADMSFTSDGLTFVPKLGAYEKDPNRRLAATVARLAQSQLQLSRGK